jgi:hypothetical protein
MQNELRQAYSNAAAFQAQPAGLVVPRPDSSFFQENPDFTLYANPVLQNWVTSEAIGHAVRSILTYQLAQP